jgi:hypothetical protein
MITAEQVTVLSKKMVSVGRELVLKWGDGAEEIVYLSGIPIKAKERLIEAIKDYRAYKEEGWRIVK